MIGRRKTKTAADQIRFRAFELANALGWFGRMIAIGNGMQFDSARTRAMTVATALLLAMTAGSTAYAEVRVWGDVALVRIDANRSPVAEVLTALGQRLNVRYNSVISLDGVVHGIFVGSLPQVLARVLEGYNYVIKRQDAAVEIVIVGTRGDRAIPAPAAQPAQPRSRAAEWRSPVGVVAPAQKP